MTDAAERHPANHFGRFWGENSLNKGNIPYTGLMKRLIEREQGALVSASAYVFKIEELRTETLHHPRCKTMVSTRHLRVSAQHKMPSGALGSDTLHWRGNG